ncbi:MAG: P-II family nitrogen regulator [Burkholderiales bacterium]|nr:P-II family nitrogen regulator [Burkholderiales bacterium]
MQIVTAIVRPVRLEALRAALRRLPGFPGMTVSDCGGMTAPERLGEERDALADFSNKVRIEIVTDEGQAGQIVDTIRACAATGSIGDGLVWVSPVEAVWRIGAAGTAADTSE